MKKPRSIYHEAAIARRAKNFICDLMAKKNISQSVLADHLGVSRAAVHSLLKGRNSLNLSTLARACYAMGVKVDFVAVEIASGVKESASDGLVEEAE